MIRQLIPVRYSRELHDRMYGRASSLALVGIVLVLFLWAALIILGVA
jgi:hypothetical protein